MREGKGVLLIQIGLLKLEVFVCSSFVVNYIGSIIEVMASTRSLWLVLEQVWKISYSTSMCSNSLELQLILALLMFWIVHVNYSSG